MAAAQDGPPMRAVEAAKRAAGRNVTHVDMFGCQFELPAADQLVFLAGIAALAVVDIIEWPVAAVMALGHLLMRSHHSKLLRDFGEALEEA